MSDLVSLVEKFGLKGIGLTILGGSLVWGLAHWSAAPGQPVSVLWGLVEYTKPARSLETQLPASVPTPTPTVSRNAMLDSPLGGNTPAPRPLGAFDPFVRHGLSGSDARALRERLRSDRGLRPLSIAEDGKNISEIPSGTYFYTLSAWLGNNPPAIVSTEAFERRLQALEASAEDLGPGWIEIHHPNQGAMELLVCTDEASAARAAHLTGVHEIEVTLSPWCTSSQYTSIISVPADRILRARARIVRTATWQRVLVDAVLH